VAEALGTLGVRFARSYKRAFEKVNDGSASVGSTSGIRLLRCMIYSHGLRIVLNGFSTNRVASSRCIVSFSTGPFVSLWLSEGLFFPYETARCAMLAKGHAKGRMRSFPHREGPVSRFFGFAWHARGHRFKSVILHLLEFSRPADSCLIDKACGMNCSAEANGLRTS
jgi:hypothetical protein